MFIGILTGVWAGKNKKAAESAAFSYDERGKAMWV
jgi:hypothetical protein